MTDRIDYGSSNPLDKDPDIAIGVTLPIRKGTSGYFEQSFVTIDQVKSNIKNLLLTKKGERLMQPDFGSGLWELLFEPNTNNLEEKMRNSIRTSVSKWLPYVNIELINIERTSVEIDMYTVEVELLFTTTNDPDALESVTFTIAT